MTSAAQEIRPAQVARFAGAMYLIQMATGVFTQLYARGSLIARGNPAQTAQNIMESEQLFRIGIVSDLATYTAVLLGVWALYVLLRPIDRNIALLAVLFRLTELAIHFNVTLNSLTVLRLLSGADYLNAFEASQLQSQAQLALGIQASGLNLGFVLLGLGSAVFAYLLLKSQYVPKALAGWGLFSSLLLSAFALLVILFPKAGALQFVPMLPMGIYEVTLGGWLLLKGARMKSSHLAVTSDSLIELSR
ncbi:MAG TPA: DUF4386 domain-containing protein [Thermoanaerobaculia bacterium]|nr:DUF4386 domain-containing protein [Thermoanaerobaculia bacterium]